MTDLTRWNRAGLRRIRYVDGNAVTYFEELRAAAAARFPDWAAVREPDRYHAGEGDTGEELLRALARVAHVLTEHVDAYANEGFLATATQWESVRLLVAALGYDPGPPASASTPLALSATAAGRVRAGLARSYSPPGGEPLVFETLDDVDVVPELSLLRPAGFDRSPAPLTGTELVVEGKLAKARSGQPVVLEDERCAEDDPQRYVAYRLTARRDDAGSTALTLDPPLDGTLVAGWTRVHAAPADRLALLGPALTGVGTLGVSVPLRNDPRPLVAAGDVVVVAEARHTYLRRVKTVLPDRLTLFAPIGGLDVDAAGVSVPVRLAVTGVTGRNVVANGDRLVVLRVDGDWTQLLGTAAGLTGLSALYEGTITHAELRGPETETAGPPRPTTTFLTIAFADTPPANPQSLLVVPPVGAAPLALDLQLRRTGSGVPSTLDTARPKHAAGGDLAVLARGGALAWGRLAEVAVDAEAGTAALTFTGAPRERGGAPYWLSDTVVHAHFAAVSRPLGHAVNTTPLMEPAIAVERVPPVLAPGRRVLARLLDDPLATVDTTVARIDGDTVVLADRPPAGATAATLVLHANVVTAGHGRSLPERVLGSGDAALAGQRFELAVANVSFVADPTMPAQVRADVVVAVDGRRWQQVGRLADSAAEDTHFEVRMTEAGYLVIGFGDGRRGRRLPTGRDNVRARFRQGAGLAGLIPPGRLDGELRGHPLLDGVLQPLASTGGSDREPIESLRENAPAALLTLDRAVSLRDFTSLAQRAASVAQAQAVADPAGRGRRDTVTVYVVPAGDAPLSSGLRDDLERFLNDHAPPAMSVTVAPYERVALECEVTVRVDPLAYDGEAVARAVRTALTHALTLPQRRLGAALSRSDVFRIVEAVAGVEDSSVAIGTAGETVRRLQALPHQVIVLDPTGPGPLVHLEAYRR